MGKTTIPTPPDTVGDDAAEAVSAMFAYFTAAQEKREALKREDEAAFDGFALQKQLAGERFEAGPERKAKYAAGEAAMERGEPAALDYGPELEEAERGRARRYPGVRAPRPACSRARARRHLCARDARASPRWSQPATGDEWQAPRFPTQPRSSIV